MLINFDAGPAALPEAVLQQASEAIINYNNSGLSILEIAHRGSLFSSILEEANGLVKELLSLDDDYEVLWLQGGGRLQFAMVPMNFLGENETAGYIDSGRWAAEAMESAALYGNVKTVASSRGDNYTYIPSWQQENVKGLRYLHITTNNTIYGTQFPYLPETDIPLIADMSSEIFSRRLDYSKFGLIYAVAQKNIGPAGVTLVVVHRSLLQEQRRILPGILSYRDMAKHKSVLNTPPVFAIYCSLLTLRWIKNKGLAEIERENEQKATLLYETIDNSKLFYGIAEKAYRSKMNVCFRMYAEDRTSEFIGFALQNGITGIKGHRSTGGFRVSLYNAISLQDVEKLARLLEQFQ